MWDAKSIHPRRSRATWSARRWPRTALSRRLIGRGKVKLADGSETEVATSWNLYQVHLKDYDLDSVSEITSAPKDLIERLRRTSPPPRRLRFIRRRHQSLVSCDGGESRRVSAAHAHRQHRQARAGCHGWAGNYKGRALSGQQADRAGLQGLDHGRSVRAKSRSQGAWPRHSRARLHEG